MSRPRIRLKDIADRTGFSINTVSVALRGSGRIPAATRDVILAAAHDLDYRPNDIARALVRRRTRTVGVILTDIMNPILTLSAYAIERLLADRGYSMILAASDNRVDKEHAAVDMLRARQVDGILIYPATHHALDHIRPLRRAGYPVVLLTGEPTAAIDLVAIDNRAGAAAATRHLIGLGHRRIAFLDAGRSHGNLEKFEGYAAALAAAGLPVDPALVADPDGGTALHGYQAMPHLMAIVPPPTALFTSTDRLAIGALRWCREAGIAVPGQLALIGFDDIEAAAFAEVPLTTVAFAADRVAEAAVARLMALIEAPEQLPEPDALVIEARLVVRRSCGAQPKDQQGRKPI